MGKRIGAVLLVAALLLSCSGCSELIGLDAQTLMSPPKTTADRQAVYELLQGDAASVTLVYPRNGDNRSAILSRDLNGDGAPEAVGFYVPGETGGVALQIFMKNEAAEWVSAGQFVNSASQVDKVFFGDLTGDGVEEVVVGWGDPQTATASVSVYQLEGTGAKELLLTTVPYGEMLLTDFDGDGVSELFVLDVAVQAAAGAETEVSPPLGSLYRFDSSLPYVASSVPLDLSVTRYSAASFASIGANQKAAVLDGLKADGSMITQIILYNAQSGVLTAPLSNAPAEHPNPTDRATAVAVTARDINADGIIDLPVAKASNTAASNGTTPDSTGYCVFWQDYNVSNGSFRTVVPSILNTSENYIVLLPNDHRTYACANDPVTRTATFYVSGRDALVREQFAVTVFSEENWETKQSALEKNERLLFSMAGRVYMLTVLDQELLKDEEKLASLCAGVSTLSE